MGFFIVLGISQKRLLRVKSALSTDSPWRVDRNGKISDMRLLSKKYELSTLDLNDVDTIYDVICKNKINFDLWRQL